MSNVAEAAGFGLLIGFLYLVWPPLALAGGGLLLVVWANTRKAGAGARVGSALGAALGAARTSWRQHRARDGGEQR